MKENTVMLRVEKVIAIDKAIEAALKISQSKKIYFFKQRARDSIALQKLTYHYQIEIKRIPRVSY